MRNTVQREKNLCVLNLCFGDAKMSENVVFQKPETFSFFCICFYLY